MTQSKPKNTFNGAEPDPDASPSELQALEISSELSEGLWTVLYTLAAQASDLLWAILIFVLLLLFGRQIIAGLLKGEFEVASSLFSAKYRRAASELDEASERAQQHSGENVAEPDVESEKGQGGERVKVATTLKKNVFISDDQKMRVLERARRCRKVMNKKRVLWIDDNPSNNLIEIRMLQSFGIRIVQVTNSNAADAALEATPGWDTFDLVLSDIERGEEEDAGIKFLGSYKSSGGLLPVIFYIHALEPKLGVPAGAFGITNRPDELLHLVIDALERQT